MCLMKFFLMIEVSSYIVCYILRILYILFLNFKVVFFIICFLSWVLGDGGLLFFFLFSVKVNFWKRVK